MSKINLFAQIISKLDRSSFKSLVKEKETDNYPVNQRGKGSITIAGGTLQPGMYMYALIADGQEVDTKRMILTE